MLGRNGEAPGNGDPDDRVKADDGRHCADNRHRRLRRVEILCSARSCEWPPSRLCDSLGIVASDAGYSAASSMHCRLRGSRLSVALAGRGAAAGPRRPDRQTSVHPASMRVASRRGPVISGAKGEPRRSVLPAAAVLLVREVGGADDPFVLGLAAAGSQPGAPHRIAPRRARRHDGPPWIIGERAPVVAWIRDLSPGGGLSRHRCLRLPQCRSPRS